MHFPDTRDVLFVNHTLLAFTHSTEARPCSPSAGNQGSRISGGTICTVVGWHLRVAPGRLTHLLDQGDATGQYDWMGKGRPRDRTGNEATFGAASLYSGGLDRALPGIAEVNAAATIFSGIDVEDPELHLSDLSGLSIDEFWQAAGAGAVGLGKDELAKVLLAVGVKYNYGMPPGVSATRAQVGAFWQSLQLQDLALAHACALGRDLAWQQFMARYKEPLTQAAIGITGSAALGHELADSLYSTLFGLTERNDERPSPLAYYSGRGSFKGFLRATLAQRHVDYHRRASRETSLPSGDLAAAPIATTPAPDILLRLGESLTAMLGALEPEERFLLSAWFLDQRTLLEISRIIRVHEATVSRRIGRLTERLHKELLASLRASGMSSAAAAEALGTDPRDIDINLRSLLQTSRSAPFPEQSVPAGPDRI
jgi:RNA polymerase sigma-70 factor (ECF subfamily)